MALLTRACHTRQPVTKVTLRAEHTQRYKPSQLLHDKGRGQSKRPWGKEPDRDILPHPPYTKAKSNQLPDARDSLQLDGVTSSLCWEQTTSLKGTGS